MGRKKETEAEQIEDAKSRTALFSGATRLNDKKGKAKNTTAKDETEKLTQETRRIADETHGATERILAKVNAAQQHGVESAQDLKAQRDQMYRIEDDLDTIQENMKVSDRLIRSINSIKGSIVNAFSSKKSEPPSVTEDRIQFEREKNRERERKVEQEIAEYHGKDKNAVPEKEAEEEEKKGGFKKGFMKLFSRRRRSSTDEAKAKKPAQVGLKDGQHDEQVVQTLTRADQNLDEVSKALANLKSLAIDMGDELQTHDHIIERVKDKADTTELMVASNNAKMRKLV